jgi:hypothetical protein
LPGGDRVPRWPANAATGRPVCHTGENLMVPRFCLLLALLVPLLLTGCNPAGKLIGAWEIDTEKAKANVQSAGSALAAMEAEMLSMLKVEAQFKDDGTLSMIGSFLGQTHNIAGTWRFLKLDGDALVLMVKMNNETNERELRVRFPDDDHLEMAPPVTAGSSDPGKTLPFRRLKKA